VRGKELAMVFQEPMTSLNPVLSIERQLTETLEAHGTITPAQARERSLEVMNWVGIPDPQRRLGQFPHHFSGGMRQRVMIAMALSCNPALLIADEPTTALDVTIQAQFLDLLTDMIDRFHASLIHITHDLFVIGQICQEVAVMYASHIVEHTRTQTLFRRPLHPYTQGLMKSIPTRAERKKFLDPIKGTVCSLLDPPPGCKFHPRCVDAKAICGREAPVLREVEPGHLVSCHLYS
jgi:oligopeptide/dipeptide ABC transporter ATP-binding protein